MFRIVTGTILILIGFVLLYFALVESLIMLIHAVVVGGLGVAIILNKNEDKIETITTTDKHTQDE